MKRVKRLLPALFALGTLALVGPQSTAFKPDLHTFGHTMITETVLSEAGYNFGSGNTVAGWTARLSDGTLVRFSDAARQLVVTGVQAVDWIAGQPYNEDGVSGWIYGELSTEEAHCDNDLIDSCSVRIIKIRDEIIVPGLRDYVDANNKFQLINARLMLGRALHTLQDFYAHSSYADNNLSGAYYAPLTTNSAAVLAARPGATTSTCRSESEPVLNSTWARNGGNYSFTTEGKKPEIITSGYFFNSNSAAGYASAPDTATASRCDHGMELFGNTVSGINKDAPYSPFTPLPFFETGTEVTNAATVASPLHLSASAMAARHTAQFLNEVVAAIRSSTTDVTKQDAMITALLGVDLAVPVIGFVIDDTGSMSDIIAGVKQNIQRVITESTTANPDSRFLVVRYGDPDVGTATIGTAAQIGTIVGNLRASGGGDCPELTNTGLLVALRAAPPRSKLLVYTDASSKDAALADQVERLALDKGIVVQYSVSGSCSPIDPSYYRIAASTGGQVLVTEHSATSVIASFIGVSIEPAGFTSRPVSIVRGTSATPRTFPIDVESGVTALSFTATFDNGSVELFDPSGAKITSTTVGAAVTDFLGGRGFNVKTPAAGGWRAEFTPVNTSAFSIAANVTSTIDIGELRFFSDSATGRTGHEASLPYLNGPPSNTLAKFELRLKSMTASSLTGVTFVADDGTVLGSPTLTSIGAGVYAGQVRVPTQPFRVRATGLDSTSKAYSRVAPALISPRSYTLNLPDNPIWVAGVKNAVRLNIENHGDVASFAISATLAGTVPVVASPTLSVLPQASASTDVAVTIPATAAGTTQELTVSVRLGSTTDTYKLPLQVLVDSDGDGIADEEESGSDGRQPNFDGNADGVPDRLQATVLSMHSRQRGLYLTASIDGPGRFTSALAQSVPVALASTGSRTFPAELLSMKVTGLTSGASTQVVMRVSDYLQVGGFSGYAPVSSGTPAVVYAFATNAAPGATATGSTLNLSLTDGAIGDTDLTRNGEIAIDGGVTSIQIKGLDLTKRDPAVEPEPSSGTGGGCTTGTGGPGDTSLVILSAVALLLLVWRRWALKRRARRPRGPDAAD